MSNIASAAAVSIVLVHGGFVDGSGWQGVYNILKKDGYSVSIVQNPTLTLEGDVAATKQVIDAQTGPVVLVGHSYGGVVITEAGNDPKVEGLVYITAFAPDKGESVGALIANPPPGAPVPPIMPAGDGVCCFSIRRSSRRPSRRMSRRMRRRSWPTRRRRGVLRL
jgi:pimeloyl-ACP methyl ester carboxylesterase